MSNFHLKTNFQRFNNIQCWTQTFHNKPKIKPDEHLLKQLSARNNLSSPSYRPRDQQLYKSNKKEQYLRKSAPILKYSDSNTSSLQKYHQQNKGRNTLSRGTIRNTISERRKIYSPETHRIREHNRNKKSVSQFKMQIHNMKQVKFEDEEIQGFYNSEEREREETRKQKREYLKKGESLNRQIITNLLKTKLVRGEEDPREEQIVRLIKLYKGADFIKKKQNFVCSPPKKQKKRVEENLENRNKDSLIEIEGWQTQNH